MVSRSRLSLGSYERRRRTWLYGVGVAGESRLARSRSEPAWSIPRAGLWRRRVEVGAVELGARRQHSARAGSLACFRDRRFPSRSLDPRS